MFLLSVVEAEILSALSKAEKIKLYMSDFFETMASSYSLNDTQLSVWDFLTSAIFKNENCLPKREPSLFFDGTPFGTSLCLTEEAFSMRSLMELGVCDKLLSEQIDGSLSALSSLYKILDWSQSAGTVNWFSHSIFPQNPQELENWWGGMWIGTAMGADGKIELRIYFNLRNGSLSERWAKIHHTLEPFASNASYLLSDEFWDASVESTAVPVGLGVVFSNDSLKGIRLYQGLEKSHSAKVSELFEKTAKGLAADREIVEPLKKLEELYCFAVPQSFTVSHDFRIVKGLLSDKASRIKCDVSCSQFVTAGADGFENWLLSTLDDTGQQSLKDFASLLQKSFGGASLDYFSLGAQVDGSHRTVYVRPMGLAYSDDN